MPGVSSEGFKEWLNSHVTNEAYNRNPTKVCKLCSGQADPVQKFKALVENKNLVLLIKAPFGGKCQATFFHSVIGCPITPDDLRFAAKSGIEKGVGVELDPSSIFTSTTAKYVPSLTNPMEVTS